MIFLLSLHRQNQHTYSLIIDTFEPSSCEIARLFCFFECKKKTSSVAGYVVGETRISNCATDEEKFSNKIHYGLCKGNKFFVTFATINNN